MHSLPRIGSPKVVTIFIIILDPILAKFDTISVISAIQLVTRTSQSVTTMKIFEVQDKLPVPRRALHSTVTIRSHATRKLLAFQITFIVIWWRHEVPRKASIQIGNSRLRVVWCTLIMRTLSSRWKTANLPISDAREQAARYSTIIGGDAFSPGTFQDEPPDLLNPTTRQIRICFHNYRWIQKRLGPTSDSEIGSDLWVGWEGGDTYRTGCLIVFLLRSHKFFPKSGRYSCDIGWRTWYAGREWSDQFILPYGKTEFTSILRRNPSQNFIRARKFRTRAVHHVKHMIPITSNMYSADAYVKHSSVRSSEVELMCLFNISGFWLHTDMVMNDYQCRKQDGRTPIALTFKERIMLHWVKCNSDSVGPYKNWRKNMPMGAWESTRIKEKKSVSFITLLSLRI